DQQLETLNNELIQSTEDVEKLTGQYKLIEERQKNQSQSNARIEEEQESLTHQQRVLEEETSAVHKKIEQLKYQKQTLATEIHELEVSLDGTQNTSETDLETLKDDYYACMSQQSEVNNEIRFLERTIKEHQTKQSRLDSRLTEAYQQLKEAQQHISQIEIQKKEKETHLDAVAKQNQQIEQKLTEAKATQKTSEDKLYQAYRYTDQLKYRLEGLRMQENEMTYFYQGVKSVLNATHLSGIHGAVAQSIQVPTDLTAAIEVALGASMQHIIVDDEVSARQAIQYLKQQKRGRATFLPLSVIKPKYLDQTLIEKAASFDGFINIANKAIETKPTYQGIIDNLLGRTMIVDHIKNANTIARVLQYKFRIVPLEGDVVKPARSLTGRGPRQNQSLLTQQHDIQR
ncbi:chromosome segregation protein SMC, partial [Staphylococcus equorum]